MQIVRKKLSATEITPPNIRYNPDCDCVEQTWDGGTTWTPTPGSDPRISPAFRAPARTGDDPQCNAAANMVAALRDMVDGDVAADNSLALATLLLGTALLFVPVAGWIADAFLLVADAIILLDQATIEAAFTSTVYDSLLCTFFDHMDADGQMSDEQLTAFLEDVFTNYDFTVYSVISAHSDSLGAVGWSNMGALGTATGADCAACGGWCYEWSSVADMLADGFDAFQNDPQSKFLQYIGVFTFHRILFGWTSTQLGGDSALAIWRTPGETDAIVFATPLSGAPNPAEYDSTPFTVDGVSFGINADDEFGVVELVDPALRIEGTGAMPPWTHGTAC